MFGFFKKKPATPPVETTEIPLTETEREAYLNEIVTLKKQIASAKEESESEGQQASLYEKLGLAYEALAETEAAIEALEQSLQLKLSIGEGYKKLMHLYNGKRAEAARNGDDAGIEKYMNKMDDMRQIAKKVTITG